MSAEVADPKRPLSFRLRENGEAVLAAGGSLKRPDHERNPRLARRLWLICELALVYIGAPLAMAYAIIAWHVPLFLVLQPVLIVFIAYLLWDDGFLMRRELSMGVHPRIVLWIVLCFAVIGSAISYGAWLYYPDRFLAMPRYATQFWYFLLVAYPVLSVLPQELVFRTFFFHRYGPLFGDWHWLAILVNGLVFGFAHIIFGNWFAVIGTALIGVLFAYRYETTRSFWAVWIEHSLYGCLIFTVGLGRFFFTGISNLN